MRLFQKKTSTRRRSLGLGAAMLSALVIYGTVMDSPSLAQGDLAAQVERLAKKLDEQQERIEAQDRAIVEQQNMIETQRLKLEHQSRLYGVMNEQSALAVDLDSMRGGGPGDGLILLAQAGAANATTPVRPVGEAPPEREPEPVAALPEGQGVLTPPRRLILEPSFDYTRSSSNRLVYRGVEIVTGVQVGLLEANDVDRDTVSAAIAARYGVTNRIEVEARVPYIARNDRVLTIAQRDTQVSRSNELNGSDIGDVEASVRYQINRPRNGGPVFVANGRLKAATGAGPYDVARDADGVATELATGSGFWGASAGVSMLLPSDPAVIFASLSYGYNAPRGVDRQVGQAFIGRVNPGDSVSLGAGFGFSINPRLSFSLGYSHSYLQGTKTIISNTRQMSPELHVGGVNFGMSYRINPRMTVSGSAELGSTRDSPDSRVMIRLPIALDLRRKEARK